MNELLPPCFLDIDKPAGMSSRAVVDVVGRCLRTKRLGHAGTLDPLATGVLVLAVGKATRLVEYVQQLPKTYRSTFLFGQCSTTDDIEGELTPTTVSDAPALAAVQQAIRPFVGSVMQRPPAVSAIKVAGRRAYQQARAGVKVVLPARPVEVHRFEILQYDFPRLVVEVECGSGTYIRSLARDLGEALGVGGVVEALRRTHIGPISVTDALPLAELTPASLSRAVRPLSIGLFHLPALVLTTPQIIAFNQGKAIAVPDQLPRTTSTWAAWSVEQDFVGIASLDLDRQVFSAVKAGFFYPTAG